MQTVNEFLNRCWYGSKIIVIYWADCEIYLAAHDIDAIKEKAKFVGTPHELRSDTFKDVREMTVDSFGAMDDYIIIETHR